MTATARPTRSLLPFLPRVTIEWARTQDTSALDKLLVENLRTIPGVTRTHTTIVLSSVKEETRVTAPRKGAEP